MTKQLTRRDILKFTGGGILGIMFSPLPWKLLDDSAIWTQNWSLTPKLPRGTITTAFSHCTLCNAGCAIQARCVAGMPYQISGVTGHPITHGSICTRGLAGHHMAFHPLRIDHPHTFVGKSDNSRMTAIALKDSLDVISERIKNSNGTVAILDHQPNRIMSRLYNDFLDRLPNSRYITPPSIEDGMLIALQEMTKTPSILLGYDFENTKLILSFGAPLLDGFGIPGMMTSLRHEKNVRFIQLESRYSKTAMQSNQWVPLRPGTEKIVALNIAFVLINEDRVPSALTSRMVDFKNYLTIVNKFNPAITADQTGINEQTIRSIAYEISASDSTIVLSGADPGGGPFDHETENAIASLNLLLGNVGKKGGIISRKALPGYHTSERTHRWKEIPNNSISVLFVDGSDSGYAVPWRLLEKKLTPDATVVSFSPVINEISAHSDFLIPSPAFLEALTDIPTPAGNPVASFALSVPLLKKNENTTDPAFVLQEITSRLHLSAPMPTYDELLREKVETIYKQQRGSLAVYPGNATKKMSDIGSSDELMTTLMEGAQWIDEPVQQTPVQSIQFGVSDTPHHDPISGIPLLAYGWRGAISSSQISPILSKVFQETELRKGNGVIEMNPSTARDFGLSNAGPAVLTTSQGSMNITVHYDAAIRPGVIELPIAPQPNGCETPSHPLGHSALNLCDLSEEGTWRITQAQISKA